MIVQKIKTTVIFEFKELPIVMLKDKSIYHKIKDKTIKQRLR